MRHKKVQKRKTEPDVIYQNALVAKFINSMMKDGKKTVAAKIMYSTFDLLSKKNQDALSVFERAVQNVGPRVEVKARRVGGASYQIPLEVRGDKKVSLAIRWLIDAARKRSNREYHKFEEKLAAEFLDAIDNKGEAIKKRDTVHRMAEANKAFAHFRW
ncbi:MAG TPA: 30S ribosomal protein S7 [Candidatus Saccharimonadales bacterium]|nr:30S ribosomal protein S7 [Candidatus Saccharimonadales bacterium]